MGCDVNCKQCTSSDLDYMRIESFTVSPEGLVKPGEWVSFSFTIKNTSFVGALTTVACLYDENDKCIKSSVQEIGAYGSADIRWDNVFAMGYKSRKFNLSIVTRAITFTSCHDFMDFVVDVYSEPEQQRYDCAGTQCITKQGGQFLDYNQCVEYCASTDGGGGKTSCKSSADCSSTQTCIFGQCVEKQTVFIGVGLVLAYMILSR